MRPEFNIALTVAGETVLDEVSQRLRNPELNLTGQVIRGHAVIMIPKVRRSILSPTLDLETVADDGVEVMKGRFHPHPNVWTGFMALFGILGLLGVAGLMYGFAQMTVHETPWALWAGPAAAALIAFVYGAAFIGQGLSAEEMHEMRSFVEGLVHEIDPDASISRG